MLSWWCRFDSPPVKLALGFRYVFSLQQVIAVSRLVFCSNDEQSWKAITGSKCRTMGWWGIINWKVCRTRRPGGTEEKYVKLVRIVDADGVLPDNKPTWSSLHLPHPARTHSATHFIHLRHATESGASSVSVLHTGGSLFWWQLLICLSILGSYL
jgi:hypothetical protein